MAEDLRMALQALLRKAELNGDIDFLREGVRVLAQEVMELEVAQHLGAERYERAVGRSGERNGYRDRTWDTRVGRIEVRVPRVRTVPTSRACSSRAGAANARWSRSSRKRTAR